MLHDVSGRIARFAITVAIAIVSGPVPIVRAQQAAEVSSEAPKLTVERLRDDVFVLRGGARANSGVFIRKQSVVLVDVRGGWGEALRAGIGTLTTKPLTTIINTHAHRGHVNGNPEGFAATVEIIAHASAAARMATMPVFVESRGIGLPSRTFTDRLTLGEGNDKIEIYYFGRGHTDGDAWVVFPAARTLYVDIFPGLELPLLDAENGGSGVEMPATLERAVAALGGGVDTVITAHGPVLTMQDLRDYAAFNREFLETVQAAKRAGRSADEIAGAWRIPARYAHYAAPEPERVRDNVELIVAETR